MPVRPRIAVIATISIVFGWLVASPDVRGQTAVLAPQTGSGFVAGQVVDSLSGRPVPEALVRISGRVSAMAPPTGRGLAVPQPVLADAQGRFFFAGLPTGFYTIEPSKSGYLPTPATTTLTLTAGDRLVDVRVLLARAAALSGTVRDENGDPVVKTDVIAARRLLNNGRPMVVPFGRRTTDDHGAYRIGGLPAGDYFVCACGTDPNPFDSTLLTTLAAEPANLMSVAVRALSVGADVVSLDATLRTPAPTLYPDSPSFARAQRVRLQPGDDKAGIDIRVPLVRAARVSGRIVGTTRALQADAIRLMPAADLDAGSGDLLQLQPMLVQTDGRFDFARVPPGEYRLVAAQRENALAASGPSGAAMGFVGPRGASPPPAVPARGPNPASEPALWANELVTVPESGVSGLVIALRPVVPIRGRVEFEGAPPPPAALPNVIIGVQSVTSGSSAPTASTSGRPGATGEFNLPGVAPGKYVVSSSVPSGFTAITSVVLGGVDVTDLALDVSDRPLGDLVITWTKRPLGGVTITQQPLPAAHAVDGSLAVIFPTDRRYWAEPVAARRRMRAVPLAIGGTASVPDVPDGEYFVAILPAAQGETWMDLSALTDLSRLAQRVTVTGGQQANIGVRR